MEPSGRNRVATGGKCETNHDLPWHRVVRADGTIPQGQPQRKLLRAEGVPMRGNRVDLDQARLPPEL
jgi:alkylated DNA nucleotide flippase Atl1